MKANKTSVIILRIEPEEKERIRANAKAKGEKISRFIRELIRMHE